MNAAARARLAVRGATAALLAMALASVAIWGRNIGVAEDWLMVPAMTGNEPDLAGWLWSQNNEHRLPVQRALYFALLRTTEDFRAGMVASQLLLAALALLLARAAAAARGGPPELSDALFPLALLHIGHWENLVWGWQIQFVWSVFLWGAAFALVAARPGPPGWRGVAAAAALAVLLPLSGANGIVVGLTLAGWMAAQGVALTPADRFGRLAPLAGLLSVPTADPRRGLWLAVGAAGAAVATGLYFVGYARPDGAPPLADATQFLKAARLYFAYALGTWTRWAATPAAVFVALYVAGGGLLALAAVLRRGPPERLRAGGIALFVATGVALGLVIALTRGGYPYRMPDRYALFAVMPLLGAALAWRLYAPPMVGRAAYGGLALLFLVTTPLNLRAGFEWRDWYLDGARAVEADLAAGLPAAAIAERNRLFLMHWDTPKLIAAIGMLEEAGIGPFARGAEAREGAAP